MPVEGCISIAGRGTVVTGRIERGVVKVNDEVEIVGIRATRRPPARGLRCSQALDEGQAGDNVGCCCAARRERKWRRAVLCKPGASIRTRKFEAEVYVLTKRKGSAHAVLQGYRPQFTFARRVTGAVSCGGDGDVMPGTTSRSWWS